MADALLLGLLAGETAAAAKKLIAAVGRALFADGGTPLELFELDLCRRMNWTLTELDEQDAARVLSGLQLQDTRDHLANIQRFLDSGGKMKPSAEDLQVYDDVRRIMREEEEEDRANG